MGKLGAPSSKELNSPPAIESEIRTIRSINASESSGDDELDFIQGDDK